MSDVLPGRTRKPECDRGPLDLLDRAMKAYCFKLKISARGSCRRIFDGPVNLQVIPDKRRFRADPGSIVERSSL